MKDSKTILARHLILGLLLQILVLLLVALPPLEPFRQRLAELTTVPASALWIPLLALLVLAHIAIMRRLHRHLANPLQELVNQTKLGANSFAFKKKSMNSEEDHLKHFIESQCLKFSEMEQEVARMEKEVQRIADLSETSPEEIEALRQQLENANDKAEERLSQLAAEQKRAASLERDHDALKRELKTRGRELDTLRQELSERAASGDGDAPLPSLLAERLRNPLNLINNLAWRLARSWADTPPAQVREGLEEISRQSEEQLELLKKYQTPSSAERDAL